MRVKQVSGSINKFYLVTFNKLFHSAPQLINYIVFALHDFVPVIGVFTDEHAELFTVSKLLPFFGTFQQSLGRNAAPVQANPTQVFSLNQ